MIFVIYISVNHDNVIRVKHALVQNTRYQVSHKRLGETLFISSQLKARFIVMRQVSIFDEKVDKMRWNEPGGQML